MVAFVSGGASGLGLGTVKRLLDQGIKGCVSFDLRAPDLKHPNLISIQGDVCNETDVSNAYLKTVDKFGYFNALVSCAGIGIAAKTYDLKRDKVHSMEDFKKVLEINTVGTFNLVRLGPQHMVKNEAENGLKGCIIMTSSIAAYDAQVGQIAYAASKGAINSMTLAISRDLAGLGIRCMTIAPGVFDTPLMDKLPPKVKTLLAQQVPCPQRLGDPLEFGHLVQSILENSFLNGSVIRLDGALRMQS